jgi:hypothetical protein
MQDLSTITLYNYYSVLLFAPISHANLRMKFSNHHFSYIKASKLILKALFFVVISNPRHAYFIHIKSQISMRNKCWLTNFIFIILFHFLYKIVACFRYCLYFNSARECFDPCLQWKDLLKIKIFVYTDDSSIALTT